MADPASSPDRRRAEAMAAAERRRLLGALDRVGRRPGVTEERLEGMARSGTARAGARLHSQLNRDIYDPGRKASSHAEMYTRRAMIDSMAPEMGRLAAADKLADLFVERQTVPNAAAADAYRERVRSLDDNGIVAEIARLGEGATSDFQKQQAERQQQEVVQAAEHWGDPEKSRGLLARMGTAELTSRFADTDVSVKRGAAAIYSRSREAAETAVIGDSEYLARAAVKGMRQRDAVPEALDGARGRQADRLAARTAVEVDPRNQKDTSGAAAYLTAAGSRYGIRTSRIQSPQQLQAAMRRAASVELLAGGLAGRDRDAAVKSMAGLSDADLSKRLAGAGIGSSQVAAMTGVLETSGRRMREQGRMADRATAARRTLERGARGAEGLAGFTGALRQAGLNISMDAPRPAAPPAPGRERELLAVAAVRTSGEIAARAGELSATPRREKPFRLSPVGDRDTAGGAEAPPKTAPKEAPPPSKPEEEPTPPDKSPPATEGTEGKGAGPSTSTGDTPPEPPQRQPPAPQEAPADPKKEPLPPEGAPAPPPPPSGTKQGTPPQTPPPPVKSAPEPSQKPQDPPGTTGPKTGTQSGAPDMPPVSRAEAEYRDMEALEAGIFGSPLPSREEVAAAESPETSPPAPGLSHQADRSTPRVERTASAPAAPPESRRDSGRSAPFQPPAQDLARVLARLDRIERFMQRILPEVNGGPAA